MDVRLEIDCFLNVLGVWNWGKRLCVTKGRNVFSSFGLLLVEVKN